MNGIAHMHTSYRVSWKSKIVNLKIKKVMEMEITIFNKFVVSRNGY